jgi:hypothetical protein
MSVRIAVALAASLLGAGCHPRPPRVPFVPAAAGLAVAIYNSGNGASYAIVDDRRALAIVPGRPILLDGIDPETPLSSLLIESATTAGGLVIGACTRDAVATPPGMPKVAGVIRCDVRGASGTQLVRIAYVSPSLSYTASHELTVEDPAHAQLATVYAVTTPSWHRRADVTLYDGVPGGDRVPRALIHGAVELDGSIGELAEPARTIPARLRYVYEDTAAPDELSLDEGKLGAPASVWATLELRGIQLAPGRLHLHVALAGNSRDLVLPPSAISEAAAQDLDGPLRLPLWIDDTLHGTRTRTTQHRNANDGRVLLVERLELAVSNDGNAPREVDIVEPLRTAQERRVVASSPGKPHHRRTADADALVSRVRVPPGQTQRVSFTIAYTN